MVDAVPHLPARAGYRRGLTSRAASLSPVVAALVYPYMLELFHGLDPFSDTAALGARLAGTGALICAILVPLLGLRVAVSLGQIEKRSEFQLRASRLAFLSMTAPPLFVLFGVGLGLLGSPLRDVTAWNVL